VADLDCAQLDADPIAQFVAWFDEARAAGVPEPEAMTLATADAEGRPSARTVLLRGVDERGFRFYTNYTSRKARDLEANPRAALVFRWQPPHRQVLVTGRVARTSTQDSDSYFGSRPRDSRLGAWASDQGTELRDRAQLDERFRAARERFGGGEIPRPDHWGGFLLAPETVELWQHGAHRLHDRCLYVRAGDGWRRTRLSP
jgi:pyridoxamine 5'-phosphate oxidase